MKTFLMFFMFSALFAMLCTAKADDTEEYGDWSRDYNEHQNDPDDEESFLEAIKRARRVSNPSTPPPNDLYITFQNAAGSVVMIQCGKKKQDNPAHRIASFKVHQYFESSETTPEFWCSASYGDKIMTFLAYSPAGPRGPRLHYLFTKHGLFLDGNMVKMWI